jgi:cutinase
MVACSLGAALVTTWALLSCAPTALIRAPSASADQCPDIQVVFARGTNEPPGIGGIGQPFVDALRSQVRGRFVGVYAVNYPASDDYAKSASDGANDASAHVQYMAANCPNTKMVLGGFSQGAAVIDLITASAVPDFVSSTPIPPQVADHVAAVALFGNPSNRFVGGPGGPLTAISPLYRPKTIDLCAPFDPVCSDGFSLITVAHGLYVVSGMVSQAATFAATRI